MEGPNLKGMLSESLPEPAAAELTRGTAGSMKPLLGRKRFGS